MDHVDNVLADRLGSIISAALGEKETAKAIDKAVQDLTYRVESDIGFAMKENLARDLQSWVMELAQRAVEQILEGNEDQLRRYLSCEKRSDTGEYIGWTGRSDSQVWGREREPHEWHSVIHGNLFEQGAVALRKKIVDAHRDLLVNERILDLEDQVKSLIAQVNKANAEKDQMWERLRAAGPS